MEIKMLESIDYDVVARLLYESYIPQWNNTGCPEWNTEYIEYLIKSYIKPRNGLCIGALKDGTLVGIGFGYINDWMVAELGKITTICVCNLGVLPAHQRRGVATGIIKKLEEDAQNRGVHLIYRICNEELNDHKGFAQARYAKKLNNVYQMARIMGKEMIDTTAKLKGYGRGVKMLLKAIAGFPKEKNKIQYGTIREGTEADIAACIELLNSYQNIAEISQVWSENEFANIINNGIILQKKPFALIYYVWEVDRIVKAFVAGRFEKIIYERGTGISAIISHAGFAGDLDRKDKTSFIVSVLYEIKAREPNTFATNLAVAHHEEKAFDKAGFNNDRSTRPLYVKSLNDSVNEWVQTPWKYKRYCIPYQR